MINVAISYRPSEENSYQLKNIPANIQLSLYKYDLYEDNRDFILKEIEDNASKIRVVHLPLDTLHLDFVKIDKLIQDIFSRTGCEKYVIHPNKGITKFIKKFNRSRHYNKMLCVETFAWKRNKVFRSPLEIIDACKRFNIVSHSIWMTIDTCHIEDIWFDHKIMAYLLKFTKVIHLSNRAKGIGSHMPFNHPKGELNLVSFVRELKHKYKWSGDIVLEYMPEYSTKLIKNHNYVKRLLGE